MKKKLFLLLFPLVALFGAKESLADHVGDYYDNRDNNHANMGTSSHPGLTYMASGYGIQLSVIPDKVVFGNSSTAVTSSRYWGSNPRAGYMRYSSRMQIAYDIYANNNAYWYPEHRDHDEVDYFFAQSPYYNVSQGSSGSEIDEMHKWFYTLNAFKSDTKALLTAKKLIAPTMQMIARRTRVSSDAEYLTGAAHPNAFDNYSNQAAMVAMATEMQASRIPPMVQIRVVEEDYDQRNNGLNFFEPYSIPSEKLFDTPQSISRLFLGFGYTRRVVVSAEDSYDPNGLPLTYYWKVLRGNAEHVRIRSLNTNNSKVEITLDYHPETTIGNTARLSNLVSVGVFVNNGYYYSAPAFVNSYTKRNETRTYDQAGKITKIVYNSNDVDPVISFAKTWTSDEFRYDGNGALTRIDRIKDGVSYNFTKEGYLIESFTPDNKPDLVARVTYSYNTSDYKVFWQKSGNSFNYGVCQEWVYSAWSACTDGVMSRTVQSALPDGCSGGSPVLTQSCGISDNPRTNVCTSWTYSGWSACADGVQSRTVLTSSPSGCSGGYPVLTQKCVATAPTCTSWTYSNWSDCDNGTKYRNIIFSTPTNCSGGSPILTQSCDVPAPTCTSWTYSAWSTCSSNGTQTRSILTSSPSSCSGGSPVLTQSCVAPTPTCTSWTYSDWSSCSSSGTQSRTVLASSPSGCSGGSPVLTQNCSSVNPADSRYKSLYNIDQLLPVVGMSRNTGLEQYNYERYLAELEVPDSDTPEETRQALDVFVTYGADENTNKLGVGERVAVVSSYREAFNRLPETESDLSDLIKIASGEWPTATSPEAERKAKEQFITIYKRIPDMRDPRDNAAVVIMAYGFRQKAINRNLGSEALAIKSFRGIYGFNPSNTSGWNAVQAIAYSGAARGVDTDGDLLTDEREILLGTDKNNPDTDGDGYRDGIEVLNGYNPKGEGKL